MTEIAPKTDRSASLKIMANSPSAEQNKDGMLLKPSAQDKGSFDILNKLLYLRTMSKATMDVDDESFHVP